MARDISEWLEDLGLGKYAEVFAENEIDLAALPHVTEEDLKAIGVALGARRKLLAAITAIREVDAAAAVAPESLPSGAPEAERRQLTVLFADLVGSTALAQQLDPEDMRDVITAYQNTVAAEVARYEGHLAKYMGDGVLVYFGWPQAHEDDAERAVRGGLAVVQALAGRKTPGGQSVEARIGIATGLVVVGDLVGEGAAQEEAVVGETPNLAARLQGVAESGQIVLSTTTRGLLGELFELADLGPQVLKGFAEPIEAYAVVGERAVESRYAARVAGGVLPLFGREQELALLLDRWRQSKTGEGQMVLLTGEAGIGKSRIARATIDAIAEEPNIRINYQCSPYHADSALYPAIQQLIQTAGLAMDDSLEVKLDKLEALLTQAHDDVGEAAPLIASLLGLAVEERYGALELSSEQQRARTLEALISRLLSLAREHPVLFVLEDVHWVDPTTLELIELALDRVAEAPVLLLVTARPNFTHGFGGHPIVTRLALNRLGRAQIEGMIARLSGGKALPAEVLNEIVGKTDGVPLFVEELTKTVLESGMLRETADAFVLDTPLQGLSIPSTLNDSLMARLDQLQPVKEVAQTAACIGREFGYGLLAAVSPLSDAKLREALDGLVTAELIFRHGQPPEATYTFKHALVQEAAYDSLLRATRQSVHGRIAEALLAGPAETAATHPELLAQHFTAANRPEDAVGYWLRAGRQAAGRSADKEAIGHLNKGLAVLDSLPASTARSRQELQFRIALFAPLMSTTFWTSEESAETFARARELCEELGETEELSRVLFGPYASHLIAAKLHAAKELAGQILRLGEQQQDAATMMQGHRLVAWPALLLAELAEVRSHLDEALSLYDPRRDSAISSATSTDPRVAMLCCRTYQQWLTGFADQAFRTSAEAIASARALNHASSLAYTLIIGGAHLAAMARDARMTEELANESMVLSEEQGFSMFLPWGRVASGWATGKRGKCEEGAALLCQGLEELRAGGQKVWLPFYLALLAELHTDSGEVETALEALDEARRLAEETDERIWEAEIHRLIGEARLA
jgi:class 3 adenylate cyclase/predicted ATPase